MHFIPFFPQIEIQNFPNIKNGSNNDVKVIKKSNIII